MEVEAEVVVETLAEDEVGEEEIVELGDEVWAEDQAHSQMRVIWEVISHQIWSMRDMLFITLSSENE
jgi:hypothetical protein